TIRMIRGCSPSAARARSSSRLITMPSIASLRNARSTSEADGYSTSCTLFASRRPRSRARYSGSLPIQTFVPIRSTGSGSRMQPASANSTHATHTITPSQYTDVGYRFIVSSSSVGDEDVAFVADRANEARMLGIGLDLLAQPHDAQIDAAIERIPVALIEVQDPLARQRPVRMLGERLQQIVFERRHRDLDPSLVG